MGFAVWIKPDAHLAQHPLLSDGEQQELWPAGMTPTTDR